MTEKMLVPPTNYLEAMGVIDGMRAEIDRLRAERDGQRKENAKLHKSIEENLESLQRENAELKQCADAAITDKFREIAKVERLRAENENMTKRLRNPEMTWAENSRLRAEIEWRRKSAADSLNGKNPYEEIDHLRAENTRLVQAIETCSGSCHAILATHAEGPNAAPEC